MASAFVVGHTGKAGRALCRELAAQNRFPRVVLIGRKSVSVEEYGVNFECKVVNFDELKAEDFHGFEQGFCSLGTTPSHGKEHFVKIDRDLVVRVAELAKLNGCKHFHLVTSQSSSENSSSFYWRVKGEAEKGVIAQQFEQLTIYRPGMILYDSTENNIRSQFIQSLFKPFEWAMPSRITTPIEVMVKTMLARSKCNNSGVMIMETQDMLKAYKFSKMQSP